MHWSPNLDSVDAERSVEQARLDDCSSRRERNELGQFATPATLANDIAMAVARFCNFDQVHFFEPALGTGAFFGAFLRQFPSAKIASATGVELDDAYANAARRLWEGTGLRVITDDFTKIEPQKLFGTKLPNVILTNPPYVRHHHLTSDDKGRLQWITSRVMGTSVSGLSGLYIYFMLHAHNFLAQDGIGAWLIPSEFMDVNYGEVLRRYLSHQVELLQIHRFEPTDVQFADALVSSAVVIFRKRKPSDHQATLISHGGTVAGPVASLHAELSTLRESHKWSRLFSSTSDRNLDRRPLSTLFVIKRGIATGANDFFILSRQELARLGISEGFVRPILPPARLLEQQVISADASGFPVIGEQMAIIDSDMPMELIKQSCEGLWRYLKTGEKQEIHKRYLLTKRAPWYRQEQREPAPFLCTYMGRKKASGNTFRFFWNKSQAIAANTYLLLYPTNPLKEALRKDPCLGEHVLRLLNSLSPEDFLENGRVYGGGLFKMEPRELGRVDGRKIIQELNLSVPEQGTLISV